MKIRVATRNVSDRVAVVGLEGEVDIYTSPRLKQELVELLARGVKTVIVDLSVIEFLDSTGLGVLIGGLKRSREVGGDLLLICDNDRILRVFNITGLTKIFDMYSSETEALQGQE